MDVRLRRLTKDFEREQMKFGTLSHEADRYSNWIRQTQGEYTNWRRRIKLDNQIST